MRSLILDSVSHNDTQCCVEVTTESCLRTMRSEISDAAIQHRNLVEQFTSSAPLSHSSSADSCDRLAGNNGSDTQSVSDSSVTRSVSSSAD